MITTFEELISTPDTHKITLAEITPGENLVTQSWTQEGSPNTNVWRLSYLQESVTLSDGTQHIFVKSVDSMKADSTDLSVQASIANVHANSNSFWHDTANSLLYVNVGGDPSTTVDVLIAYFKLRFATEGVTLDDKDYDPYLQGAPGISHSAQDILSAFSEIGGGDVGLDNSDGLFDTIIEKFIWINRTFALLYGGEDLAYDEYQTAFTGVITKKRWGLTAITLTIENIKQTLERTLPEDVFDSTTYPNMDSQIEGKVIPIAFGTAIEASAPIVAAIDESLGTDQVQFKIAGHEIFSVDNAWVSYDNGDTWTQLTFADPLTGSNQYKVSSLPNATIDVEFTASGYVTGQTRVKVAFKGIENSDTTQMVSFSDFAKELLVTYNEFTTADLDTTSFSDSKTESDATGFIYLDKSQKTSEIIKKIAKSDAAFFDVDADGKFVYKVWTPTVDSDAPTYDDSDLLTFSVEYDTDEHFTSVSVGYSMDPKTGEYLYAVNTSEEAQNLTGVKNTKPIETYLDNQSDANILGQRHLLLRKNPTAKVSSSVKLQLAQKNIGGQIKITRSRAPGGAWTAKRLEIISIIKDVANNVIRFICDDLKGIGESMGIWVSSSAPVYTAATDAEKESQGFWLDSNGLADPGDPESKNVSIWY